MTEKSERNGETKKNSVEKSELYRVKFAPKKGGEINKKKTRKHRIKKAKKNIVVKVRAVVVIPYPPIFLPFFDQFFSIFCVTFFPFL